MRPVSEKKESVPAVRVGAVRDPAEREADRVASMLVSPRARGATGCAACAAGDAPCPACNAGADSLTGATGGDRSLRSASAKGAVLPGAGAPLPDTLRGRFERRLGTDLSGIRLHTDRAADRATRALGTRAFSLGRDIALGARGPRPPSAAGERLLAHEVAHSVADPGGAVLRREPPPAGAREPGASPDTAPTCVDPGPYAFIEPISAPEPQTCGPTRVEVTLPGVGGAEAQRETVELVEPYESARPLVLYAIPIGLTNLASSAECAEPPRSSGEDAPDWSDPGVVRFVGVPRVTPDTVTAGGTRLAPELVTDAFVIVSEYHHMAVGAGALTVLETAQGVRLIDAGVGRQGGAALSVAMLDRVGRILNGRPILEVMITHLHADHTNLLPALAERFPIGRIRVNALQFADPRFQQLLTEIAEAQARGVRNRAAAEFDAGRSAWEAGEGSRIADSALREEAFRSARRQHIGEALRRLAESPTQIELFVPEGGRSVAAEAPMGTLRDLTRATSDPVTEGVRRSGVPGDIADTAFTDPEIGRQLEAQRARTATDPAARVPDTVIDAKSTSFIIELPAGNRLIVAPDVRTNDLTRRATDTSGTKRANLEAELARLGSPARFQAWNMTHHMQSGWVEGGAPNIARTSQLDGFVSLLHDIREAQAAARAPGAAAPADLVVVSAQHEALGRSLVNPAMVWFLRACGFEVFLAASGRDIRLIEATTASGQRVEGVSGLPAEGLRPSDPLLSQAEAAARYLDGEIADQNARRAPRRMPTAEHQARIHSLTEAKNGVMSAREAYVRAVSEEIWRGANDSSRPAVAPDPSRPLPPTIEAAEQALRTAMASPELADFTPPRPGEVPVITDTALVLLRRHGEAPLDTAARRVLEANQRADVLRRRLLDGERPAETRAELTRELGVLREAIVEQLAESPEGSRAVLQEELTHTQRELESLVRSGEGEVLFTREPGTGRLIENRIVFEPAPEPSAADRMRSRAETAGRFLGAVMVYQTIREQGELEERVRSGEATGTEAVAGFVHNAHGLAIGLRMMSVVHVHPGEFLVLSTISITQAVAADYDSPEEAAVAISRTGITEGVNLFLFVLSQIMMGTQNPYLVAAGFGVMLLGHPIVALLDYLGLFDLIERASAFLPSEVTGVSQELRDLMSDYRAALGAVRLAERSDAELRGIGVDDPAALRRSSAADVAEHRGDARNTERELLTAFEDAYDRARTEYAGLYALDRLRDEFLGLREQVHRGEAGGGGPAEETLDAFAAIDRSLGEETVAMTDAQVLAMPQWTHLNEGLDSLEALLRAREIDWEEVRERHTEVQQMLRNARYRIDPGAYGMRSAALMPADAPGRGIYDQLLGDAEARLNRDEMALFADAPGAALDPITRSPLGLTMRTVPAAREIPPLFEVGLAAVEQALARYDALIGAAPEHPDAAALNRYSEAVAVVYRRFVRDHDGYAAYLERLQTTEMALLRLTEQALATAAPGEAPPDVALRVRSAVTRRRDRDGLLFLDELAGVAARVRATETARLAPLLGEAPGTSPLVPEELEALAGGELEDLSEGVSTISNRLDQVEGLRIPDNPDEVIGGVYRVVGTIESLPLLITEIPITTLSADQNVLVGRAGPAQEGIAPRGHYDIVPVVPLNAAAVRVLGGTGVRPLPDYTLLPVRLAELGPAAGGSRPDQTEDTVR